MVNLEHKLTVDDLIVEYMIGKVKGGYEPSFLGEEFIDFLHFFERKMEVEDVLYDSEKLFQRFFERKAEHDWSITKNYDTGEKEINPHMDMEYSEKEKDYLIRTGYKLSGFDSSIINTYFMYDGRPKEIRKIISEYLFNQPKRIIETIEVDEKELLVGKHVAMEIISNIWKSHIHEQIENHVWPRQCQDINKYLFEMDLAEIIGAKSIKKELLELYSVLSKRVAVLYHQDKNLQISSYSNIYLAKANYELLIQGYENIISIAFGEYKKSLNIDLTTMEFRESHEIDGVYYWDEDPDIKTNSTQIGDNNTQELIRSLEKNVNKTSA